MANTPGNVISDDEFDGEQIPEIDLSINIQPYMYEPVLNATDIVDPDSDASNSDNEEQHDDDPDIDQGPSVDEWCFCGNCVNMPTARESVCCKSVGVVMERMDQDQVDCITDHYGFEGNCLNDCVIEASYYEFLEDYGQPEQLVHETYRHLAYRRFVRWLYGILGRKNRRILPSCVVNKIRCQFPSQEYCGFKYPN